MVVKSIIGFLRFLAVVALVLPVVPGCTRELHKAAGHGDTLTNSLGMTFVYIGPGTFVMGSPDAEPGRFEGEIQHKVTLTTGYWLLTTEVTQGQWLAVMGTNPSHFSDCGGNCPVENISWNDAGAFIEKLNRMDNRIIYRLPTEAEWEYAARSGATTAFAFGACLSEDAANFDGSNPLSGCVKGRYREKPMPVRSFLPNSRGLYDMHGNVAEWCRDRYGSYGPDDAVDPSGPTSGDGRVSRGGSWYGSARTCRSAYRVKLTPGYRAHYLGFRLAGDSAHLTFIPQPLYSNQ